MVSSDNFNKEDRSDSSKGFSRTHSVEEWTEEGNALTEFTEEEVKAMGRNYAIRYELETPELFERGAALARRPHDYDSMDFLTEIEKHGLFMEATNRWYMPKRLFAVIAMCSMAAAVQGMDESVVNGANLFYPKGLGIGSDSERDAWLQGLTNGAPYLCCALIGCWLTDPLNKRFGRRGTVMITCTISALTCFWQGFTNTWYHLFIARFLLGLGIGPKSATVPIYSAECAPARIRGSLVMLWQFFTAFGVMFGYVSSLAFYYVPDRGIGGGGLAWRLTLGSACIPAIIVCVQVFGCPESPRWLMGEGRHQEAFESLLQLRKDKIAAARDCFYQYILLEEESSYTAIPTSTKLKEVFTVRRNRNGAIGSCIVMFMQQFCGINVIAYYSSSIFVQSGFSEVNAMLASWGFGMLNFLFALPAFYTIDTFGRRNLLLTTFPVMCVFLLMTGFAFWIPESNRDARIGVIALGVYLYCIAYSIGEGPIPFTYSAEAFPLYLRDLGMSLATAVCWFFNFILALTWPKLLQAFKPQGAFGWYAAWNIVGFFLVLNFLPETKGLTLEELDEVFYIPALEHAAYQNKKFLNLLQRRLLGRSIPPTQPLIHRRTLTKKAYYSEKAEDSVTP